MRYLNMLLLVIATSSCASGTNNEQVNTLDSNVSTTNVESDKDNETEPSRQQNDANVVVSPTPIDTTKATPQSNKRFKDVTVSRLGENKFRVRGKGQIFEASFGWYIEDGHNELKTGFATTDAGAPEWGSFDFTIDSIVKKRPNSTLHLVLFEASAKDGSRQYELPILLY